MEERISVYEFLKLSPEKQNDAWYDWFCKDTSLPRKTVALVRKLRQIALSPRFNINQTYVFFKNNCPVRGKLYDDFRICDIKTGDVLYTVVPSSGYEKDGGRAEVWGRENDFAQPLATGSWSCVVEFFLG